MTATAGNILAKFYAGEDLADDEKTVLKDKAGSRMDAYLKKNYDKIALGRSAPPGVLYKSGAANLLAPIFNKNWEPGICRDDE